MKDTGVGWIEAIPSNWTVKKNKYLFFNHKMVVGAKVEQYERLALTLGGVVKRSKEDSDGLQPMDFAAYQIVKPGELIFKLIDLQNISTSRIGLSPYTGIVSPAYIILSAKNEICCDFAFFFFTMMWMDQVFNKMGDSGVRSNLSASDLLELPFCFPCVHEQEKIASYLSKQCSMIDTNASRIEHEIEILQDYKNSVITEAVTNGIKKNVSLRSSGIEWVGLVPVSWDILPLYKCFFEGKRKNVGVKEKNLLSLSYGQIIQKDINSNEGLLPASFSTYNIVSPGDIVIRPTDLQNDKRSLRTGLVKEKGMITSAYIDLKPSGNISSEYMHYLLHSYDIKKVFYNMGNGVRQGLNYSEFSKLLILCPSLSEQTEIADFLDKKCAEIDDVIERKRKQLNVLTEYKKSLIYECVTGKKEVPNEPDTL